MIALFGFIGLVMLSIIHVQSVSAQQCYSGSFWCTNDRDCFYYCGQGCPQTGCIRYCEGCTQQVGRCWCV